MTAAFKAAVWRHWNSTTTSTSNIVTMPTCNWSTTASTSTEVWYRWHAVQQYAAREVTPAEHAARRAASAAIQAAESEARANAEKLLTDHLTPEQRESLKARGHFDVLVAGKTYRINRGYAGNVQRLDGLRAVERFCIHPSERVPDADAMLAQKLLLEADEAAFIRIANRTVLN